MSRMIIPRVLIGCCLTLACVAAQPAHAFKWTKRLGCAALGNVPERGAEICRALQRHLAWDTIESGAHGAFRLGGYSVTDVTIASTMRQARVTRADVPALQCLWKASWAADGDPGTQRVLRAGVDGLLARLGAPRCESGLATGGGCGCS